MLIHHSYLKFPWIKSPQFLISGNKSKLLCPPYALSITSLNLRFSPKGLFIPAFSLCHKVTHATLELFDLFPNWNTSFHSLIQLPIIHQGPVQNLLFSTKTISKAMALKTYQTGDGATYDLCLAQVFCFVLLIKFYSTDKT